MTPDYLLNITGESVLKFLEDYGIDTGEKFEKIIKIVSNRKLNKPILHLKNFMK